MRASSAGDTAERLADIGDRAGHRRGVGEVLVPDHLLEDRTAQELMRDGPDRARPCPRATT